MSKPDKIIYIVNARIPNEMAHSIQITHTAEALSNFCSEFLLITPYTNKTKTSEIKGLQVKHRRLPSIDTNRLGSLGFHIRSITFLLSLYPYLLYQLFISKVQKKKVVLYIRGEIVFGLIPFFTLYSVYFETHYIRNHETWYRWLLQKVEGVVVVTNSLKRKFVSEYGISSEKVTVARDAVSLKAFQTFSESELKEVRNVMPPNKKNILYAGRMSEEKGVFTLAEAAKFFNNSIHVVFLGGTDTQIKYLKEKYVTQDNISILGRVPHKMVSQYMVSADVLILPDLATDEFANQYTSPMKLFEYMASGVGIVASDIPSLREVLNQTNSFFFESGNSDSLAQAINYMLDNKNETRKRADRAKQDVEDFTWEKRAQIIINLMST